MCVALWYTQHSCCHASPRGVAKLCYKSHMANINVNTVRCMFSCMNNDCLHVTILLIILSNHKTHISFAVAPGLPLRRRVGGGLTGARHGFGCRESGGVCTCTISLGVIVFCKKYIYSTHHPTESPLPTPLPGAGVAGVDRGVQGMGGIYAWESG